MSGLPFSEQKLKTKEWTNKWKNKQMNEWINKKMQKKKVNVFAFLPVIFQQV